MVLVQEMRETTGQRYVGSGCNSKGGSRAVSSCPARLAAETKDRRTGADQSPNIILILISIILSTP